MIKLEVKMKLEDRESEYFEDAINAATEFLKGVFFSAGIDVSVAEIEVTLIP